MRMLIGVAAVLPFTSAAAQAKDKAPDAPDKVICKRVYDADTGSHFTSSKRVCHTALDWKLLEDETKRSMQTIRDHGGLDPNNRATGVGGGPGGGL
jgi:hypothetical protein